MPASLFKKKNEVPASLLVYCPACNQHAFRVHADSVVEVGVLSIQCPQCNEGVSMSVNDDGCLLVMSGYPQNSKRKRKRNDTVPDTKSS